MNETQIKKYNSIDPHAYHATRIADAVITALMLSAEYPYPCVRLALNHLMSVIQSHPDHMSPDARALMLMVRALELSSGVSRWPAQIG